MAEWMFEDVGFAGICLAIVFISIVTTSVGFRVRNGKYRRADDRHMRKMRQAESIVMRTRE